MDSEAISLAFALRKIVLTTEPSPIDIFRSEVYISYNNVSIPVFNALFKGIPKYEKTKNGKEPYWKQYCKKIRYYDLRRILIIVHKSIQNEAVKHYVGELLLELYFNDIPKLKSMITHGKIQLAMNYLDELCSKSEYIHYRKKYLSIKQDILIF